MRFKKAENGQRGASSSQDRRPAGAPLTLRLRDLFDRTAGALCIVGS